MNVAHKIIITVFLIVLGRNLQADDFNCVFEHLSTENGLSHGSISTLMKDSRGFMWFATWDGLNRYDGFNVKVFQQENSAASNRIRQLREDAAGNIWFVNYDAKAFRLNYQTEKIEKCCFPGTDSLITDVHSVYIAQTGDVWVLTARDGAFRITTHRETNRFSVQQFSENTSPAICGKSCQLLFEDSYHNIWIQTENGMSALHYNIQNANKYEVKKLASQLNKILDENTPTVFANYKKQVLVGTQQGKIIRINPHDDQVSVLHFENDKAVSSINSYETGLIYIGTSGNGLFEYNLLKKQVHHHYFSPEIKNILQMYLDAKGMIWIESSVMGIARINQLTNEVKHYTQTLHVNPDVRSGPQIGLMEEDDYTWVTLKGGGFGYYNYKTDKLNYFYNNPNDPDCKLSNFVNGFYKDSDGVLWLSTYFKGIEKISFVKNPIEHKQLVPQNRFSIANEIRALLVDSEKRFWIATKNQEVYVFNESFELIHKINAINGERIGRVYALFEDSRHVIYLGTKGKGLYSVETDKSNHFTFRQYRNNPDDAFSLSNDNIYSLSEDNKGRIWIGTYGGGINIFNGKTFLNQNNTLANSFSDNQIKVRHIVSDSKGNMWAGTTNGLLYVDHQSDSFKVKRYSPFLKNTKGLNSKDIFWLFIDSHNQLWLSSLGGGLSKLENIPEDSDHLKFKTITKNEGLPSNMIFTITQDAQGKLWMSTENNIVKYDEANNDIKVYTNFEGASAPVFSEGSVAKHPDGSISFGANTGNYKFTPATLQEKSVRLNLLFTQFNLFGEALSPGKQSPLKESVTIAKTIRLKYNQNVFSIRWSALNHYIQNNLQYQYKLVGYDEQWKQVSARGQAAYSKIPPGNYTFIVKFANDDLNRLNPPKQIQILISPPFWKSLVAYVIYVIVSLFVLIIAVRVTRTIIQLRNKVIIEKEITDMKLNFFTNISHEFRTPLTLITGPAKELSEDKSLSDKSKSLAHLIEQNAERLLKMVNQLLDFRKIQSKKFQLELTQVEMVQFMKRIAENFQNLAKEKEIDFQLNYIQQSITYIIDEEKIESVVTNLLSNAFKFTPPKGKINLYLRELKDKNSIQIKVEDNGPGVAKEQVDLLFEVFSSHHAKGNKDYTGSGIGLALSKELIELHKGKLTYTRAENGGAVFVIDLENFNNEHTLSERKLMDESALPVQEPNTVEDESEVSSTLLIVEDNMELRGFLDMQLSDNYVLMEAEDGAQGLDKAIKFQPDIILSDIMMPQLDGIEMLDRLKNNPDTSHIPVVLLTAKTTIESKIEGLRYGADAYLTKPFHIEQLKAQIENLLQQRLRLRKNITNRAEESTLPESIQLTETDTSFLQKVRAAIEANVGNSQFKMEHMYREVGMGRSKFTDKLKGLTGMSPVEFVKEYRLNYARKLLQSGQYNVSEVSYMTGFSDAGYFSKRFKEYFGNSPSDFLRT